MWISNYGNFFGFSRSYILSQGDTVHYTFNFYTTNALSSDGKIEITFPFNPISTPAGECYVSLGLEDISQSKKYLYIMFFLV